MRTLSAAILTLLLVFGSSAHALVAHDHGEAHHHGKESIVWQSLHASLQHEDKKVVSTSYLLAIVGVALIVEFSLALTGQLRFVDSHTRALRRGVLRYRRFG
jgi:hypothetical protein